MNFAMPSSEWLGLLESEYLGSFIHDGGSSIKFAVPMGNEHEDTIALSEEIRARAKRLGFVVAHVDAAITRVHMIDQLFYAVAEQIPWQETVERVVRDLADGEGYAPAPAGDGPLFRRLAVANDLDPDYLLMEFRKKIATQIFRNTKLAKDFRVAMTQLVRASLGDPQEAATVFGVLTDWLCGRNRAVSAVKPYGIYCRISRANARYLFESLLAWLSLAGYSGLTLTLDIGRISIAKNPRDGHLYYTKAGVLDAYELLRQFIDGSDHLENCLIVVVPGLEFLDEDVLGRGIGAYDALKLRVYDEVRDRTIVNPMSSLVRLTTTRGA